jgi:glycerol kinase
VARFVTRISAVPHILALGQGTSSSRAIVFDAAGRPLGSARKELAQHFPRPGWVEHDPEEIWTATRDTARQALKEAGLSARDVAAIGITNQRETVILWDRETGRPLHNAIVWQDRRTAAAMDRMRAAGLERTVRQKTGLLLDPYFSGSKLQWLLDRVPGARRKAAAGRLAAGTIDSWLVWKLTGGRRHVTDVSNASRTMLMNIRTGGWDAELCRLLKIPPSVLPKIVSSGGHIADTGPGVLDASVPIAGILGDQQAALFGQLCTRPGLVKCTYGTGCFLLMFTGARPVASRNRLLSTVAWRIGDGPTAYALEGSVFVGGAAIQWLRDGLKIIPGAPQVNDLAATVQDSGGVVVVPAFAGLGAPEWDASARGAILGLTRGSTSAHVARATLEGIAFQVADLVKAMEADTGMRLREVRVDGGAAASDLLMQFQADLLGVRVARPENLETTALGAAFMAGLASGVWPDLSSLARTMRVERTFTSKMPRRESRRRHILWRRAVARARGWEAAE